MSGRVDYRELGEELDFEFWLDREGVSYKLTRSSSGSEANIKVCPECGDRRWRTYFNPERGRGHCFVCAKSYNKLSFIKSYLDCNWPTAISHVKEVLREQGWKPKRTITAAVENGSVSLPNSFEIPTELGENLIYLENRGITTDIARYFHLRCCVEGLWRYKNDSGNLAFQSFNNRLIIPVYDLDGSLKTFQGRDLTGTSDRKYLFPMDLPGTGRFLFNGQNAPRAKRLVMGEGAFDVMAIKMALDSETTTRDVVAVGSFGKHLSSGDDNANDQLGRFLELKRLGLEEVTIMWDGEEAATQSALSAAGKLSGLGLRVRIALLPKDRDPNEVPPEVVVRAFYSAERYDSALLIKWRVKRPYAA